MLLTGAAKEHRATPAGRQVVLAVLGPSDVAGLANILGTPSGGDHTLLTPSELLVLPGRDLRALARARPQLALAWLRATTEELTSQRRDTVALASTTTGERVVVRLLQLAERFGEETDHGIRIGAHLNQDELASWAGASRESATKVLGDLRRQGLVVTHRRSITILDIDRLRAHATTGTDEEVDDDWRPPQQGPHTQRA